MGSRGRRGHDARREEHRSHATVAYRGDELDELIAASSTEIPALGAFETFDDDGDDHAFADTVNHISESELEIVEPCSSESELTVVIASSRPPPPPLESERPVAWDIPITEEAPVPSTASTAVPAVAITVPGGVPAIAEPKVVRPPALITLTIAVVAITVGILVGTSFGDLFKGPAFELSSFAGPSRAPRVAFDERVALGGGAAREKAERLEKPGRALRGMGLGLRRTNAPSAGASATNPDVDFAERLEKAQKAAKPDVDALNEALLNRPF